FTKRHIIALMVVVIIAFTLSMYKLPYYIYKPGGADALDSIVEVEGGHQSAGDMHLVTVSGGQATPVQYLWSTILPHHEIMPIHEVIPEGLSEEDYRHAQLQMMENSQEASIVVAYEAADADITIDYKGIFVVEVFEDMPAEGKLQMGDQILAVDNKRVDHAEDLISYVDTKQVGDTITLDIKRDKTELSVDVELVEYDNQKDKIGIGVGLVTDRDVTVDPDVTFSSGEIGGPSAGLMFALVIFDQLTEEDLTKGYEMAGTGEIDYDGNVLRIGGIDKKVIAADKEGCDIFFSPNENGAKDSNYTVAKKTAEEIGTDMDIVPVDTFADALDYIQHLEPKK